MEKLKVGNVIEYLGNFEDFKVYDWGEEETAEITRLLREDEVLNADVVDLIPEVLANGGIVLNIYADIRWD